MIKNELPNEFSSRTDSLKTVLQESKLSSTKIRQVELLLRDAGADYFKIEKDDGSVDVRHWAQYDLILKYHGLGENFVVYIDFD